MNPVLNSDYFCDQVGEVDPSLLLATTKIFPLNKIQTVEMEPNGKFKLIFDKAYKGTAHHADSSIHKRVNGNPIELARVVTGHINKEEKSIRLDPEGLQGTVTVKKWGMSKDFTASLTEVKAIEGGLNVSATCFIEMSHAVDYDLMAGGFIEWN